MIRLLTLPLRVTLDLLLGAEEELHVMRSHGICACGDMECRQVVDTTPYFSGL